MFLIANMSSSKIEEKTTSRQCDMISNRGLFLFFFLLLLFGVNVCVCLIFKKMSSYISFLKRLKCQPS